MSDEEEAGPWTMIGWGVFFLALGIGLFFYLRSIEQDGGSVRMNVIVLLIYNFLGKYGVLGILGGLGALMVWSGVSDMRKS